MIRKPKTYRNQFEKDQNAAVATIASMLTNCGSDLDLDDVVDLYDPVIAEVTIQTSNSELSRNQLVNALMVSAFCMQFEREFWNDPDSLFDTLSDVWMEDMGYIADANLGLKKLYDDICIREAPRTVDNLIDAIWTEQIKIILPILANHFGRLSKLFTHLVQMCDGEDRHTGCNYIAYGRAQEFLYTWAGCKPSKPIYWQ